MNLANVVADLEVTVELVKAGFVCDKTNYVWLHNDNGEVMVLPREEGTELAKKKDNTFECIPAYTANELGSYLAGLCNLTYPPIYLSFHIDHNSFDVTNDLARMTLGCFTDQQDVITGDVKEAIKYINSDMKGLGITVNWSAKAHREMFSTIENYLERYIPDRKDSLISEVGDFGVALSQIEDGRLICSVKCKKTHEVCQCSRDEKGAVRIEEGTDLVLRNLAKYITELKEEDILN